MKFEIVNESSLFSDKYETWLRQKISINSPILTLLWRANNEKAYKDVLFFAVTDDADNPILAAAINPKQIIVLSGSDNIQAVTLFANEVYKNHINFSEVFGTKELTYAFIDAYSKLSGSGYTEYVPFVIYSSKEITLPKNVDGELVLATINDLDFVATNRYEFDQETLPPDNRIALEDSYAQVSEFINKQAAYIWRVNGLDTSFAIVADLDYMAHVRFIYTLPEYRGKGYAAAMTAAVSQLKLDGGCSECCLYTDANDKTANGVYKRIGYELVSKQCAYLLN